MVDEDWGVVMSLLPDDWIARGVRTGAFKGLRKDKSAEALLRVLLMHFAGGYTLRETTVRARQAHLADLSDVALLKRLRKSKNWMAAMCAALFRERLGAVSGGSPGRRVRVVDATAVQEPGAGGSNWRVHYSVELPSIRCENLRVTATQGVGTGEGFQQHPIQAGDCLIADRAYATAKGLKYVAGRGAFVLVRFSPHNLPLWDGEGKQMEWAPWLADITRAGQIKACVAWASGPPGKGVPGRACVIRKTQEAVALSQKRIRRRASKNGQQLRPDTLRHAEYVMVFTTFPEADFDAASVLQWYRVRWQVELVFKRFKSIAQLGRLIKHDEESSKAWLYGKLLVALLAEKLHSQARVFSPWGCRYAEEADAKSMG